MRERRKKKGEEGGRKEEEGWEEEGGIQSCDVSIHHNFEFLPFSKCFPYPVYGGRECVCGV